MNELASIAGQNPVAWDERLRLRIPLCAFSRTALLVLGAGFSLHLAFIFDSGQLFLLPYLYALALLCLRRTWRGAFYSGLGVGLLTGVLQLKFFWTLFSFGAIPLWLVLALWTGLFTALGRLALREFGCKWGWLVLPVLWTGLEYFRSELYFLRFSWLTPGHAFGGAPQHMPFGGAAGVYGTGFILVAIVSLVLFAIQTHGRTRWVGIGAAGALLLGMVPVRHDSATGPSRSVRVAGVQMEFPSEVEALNRLKELARKSPNFDLAVLSEYTFSGPIPEPVLAWCKANQKYLIAGGKAPGEHGDFYNTAYVVGPNGKVLFQQAKAVPIQFFKDGLPAKQQDVWNSPWGKLGICICYDLNYTRVTDRLIKEGAEALIVPTMDVADWGEAEHRLHGRIAPARAAEYGVPVFRVASSGISQLTDKRGAVLASAPWPGSGAKISGRLQLAGAGRIPWDRVGAPVCVFVTACLGIYFARRTLRARLMKQVATSNTR